MILGVTGHRPNKLGGYRTPNPIYNSVMEGLDRLLLELQPERVITGMAMGVDQWMAELCVWNGVPFVAAIPFEGFESRWYESTKNKYYQLLTKAAEVVQVCQGEFAAWKMQRRNEWVINNCTRLGAVFDGTDGGTANTVGYARSVGKMVHYVHFIRPPPLVSNDRPLLASPVQVPASPLRADEPQVRSASETFREMREENRRWRQQQETEGQRAARRAARLAMAQNLEAEERDQEPRRNRLTIIDVTDAEKAPQEELKSSIPDFARFVDLDV